MKTLSAAEHATLVRDATVLSRDVHGVKVVQCPDGRIVKFFRRKRLVSSALLWPYAVRFERAARRLRERGIRCPEVEALYWIPSVRRHAVVYPRIEGTPLRDALARGPSEREERLSQLARHLAALHERGVYFRSAHFGNFLVDGGPEPVMIDITDVRFHRGPVAPARRASNFRALLRYAADVEALRAFGPARFVRDYLEAATMSAREQGRFLGRLSGIDPLFRQETALESARR